jgi:hypothetical protein
MGERLLAWSNVLLGSFTIEELPPTEFSVPFVEITIETMLRGHDDFYAVLVTAESLANPAIKTTAVFSVPVIIRFVDIFDSF